MVYAFECFNDLIYTIHLGFVEDCLEELLVLLELKNLVLLLCFIRIGEIVTIAVAMKRDIRVFFKIHLRFEKVAVRGRGSYSGVLFATSFDLGHSESITYLLSFAEVSRVPEPKL